MIERDTELQITSEPAISYSTCYQQCFLSDNLELMRTIESNTIDLIYCDILYGTGRNFGDYQDLKPIRSEIESHYIPRLKEMHRVLKSTGSIYLQMDTRINHWMRILIDDFFGYENFQNEIVWCYNTGGKQKEKFATKHDVILYYTKSNIKTFNNVGIIRDTGIKSFGGKIGVDENGRRYQDKKHKEKYYRYYLDEPKNAEDWWADFNNLHSQSNERVNYSTQKPKALIERIIKASSNEGDIVADFYAGSFTTAEVCKDLNRNFIGCDINPKAVEIGVKRLNGGVV